MDRIAAAIGLDRRELRRRTLLRDGDLGPTGQVFTDMAFDEELARIEQVAPWAEATRRRPNRGVGLACTVWITNAGPGGVALKLNDDGTVGLITGRSRLRLGRHGAGRDPDRGEARSACDRRTSS